MTCAVSPGFPLIAQAAAVSSLLAETEWLADHLHDTTLRIVDLRVPRHYEHGHIPGAVHLSPATLVDAHHPVHGQRLPPDQLEALMSRLGISNATHVVAYDDQGGLYAARFWWVLTSYGHTAVHVLNGGWDKWHLEGQRMTRDVPQLDPAVYTVRPVPQLLATKQEVLESLQAPDVMLVDARSALEYKGWLRYAARGGHIPGAVHLEWKRALRRDGTFLPLPSLQALVQRQGVPLDKRIITYCQVGTRAAHLAFVLTMLGYTDVAVYDGSWEEWGNDPQAPIE